MNMTKQSLEKEIFEQGPVLDAKGRPIPGFSRRSTLVYKRSAIKAPPWRIKEWDFYQVTNDHLCLQMTIGHAAYAGQVSLMLFDFAKGEKYIDASLILPLVFGRLHMPENAEKDNLLVYEKNGVTMRFETRDQKRVLTCRWKNAQDGKDLEARILLARKNPDSIVINLPFDEYEHAFYYNHKINCMIAEGYIKSGSDEWHFDRSDSFGILDWGRGVWPFHNEWYWSNGAGYLDGEMFGFNLGCGFGNTDTASENIIFYKGTSHKLGKVEFHLGENYMDPWRLTDLDGRLDLTLTPVYDRTTQIKLLWVDNCTHQMFGTFAGTAVLDDGTKLDVKNVVSFAEHAVNNW